MVLNIIGNGFDLYHGIPSSYYYFGCYLIENNPELYKKIAEMYNLRWARMSGYPFEGMESYLVEDIFWREFESHLGEVDENFIVDTHPDDLGLENDDPVEIEIDEDEVAEELKNAFVHWVRDTLDKSENYDTIREQMIGVDNNISFTNDEYFLVFNYTHTLQEVHNISEENIHYLHGECLGNDDDELIIGHGDDDRIREVEQRISELEENYNYTQPASNEIGEYNCLLRILRRLRKDVGLCMRSCEDYYNRIGGNIDVVKIYGLSLGNVDIPYLQQIKNRWPQAEWKFSYYSEEEILRILSVAENDLNLGNNQYEVFHFASENCTEILNRIIEIQGITEYERAR